jgi:hypothetical protein
MPRITGKRNVDNVNREVAKYYGAEDSPAAPPDDHKHRGSEDKRCECINGGPHTPNEKRSHAGPVALDCNREAPPALAAAYWLAASCSVVELRKNEWTYVSNSVRKALGDPVG